jgi:kynureninase
LKALLEVFEEARMTKSIEKSRQLTGYLKFLLDEIKDEHISVITPRKPIEHGCQLSIHVENADKNLFKQITARGVIADWREPNVIRVAPIPFYNSFTEVYKFINVVKDCLI